MTLPDAFRQNGQVVLAELPDGTGVLLHLDTRFYFSLNRTGLFVWKALGEEQLQTVQAIARKLAEHFEVTEDAAERDTRDLLKQLAQESLVEP